MFEGSRLKIKRANKHIFDVNEALNAFVETDFYRLFIHKDPDSGKHVLKLEITRAAPCDLPLMIGDAIHNLRSALDIAQCEVVAGVGGTPTKNTKFIFRDSRKELVDALNGGELKIAPDIIDLIADEIKPYDAPDNSLFALHRLDIADKHVLILPTFSAVRVEIVKANSYIYKEGVRVLRGTISNMTLIVEQGGILNAIGFGTSDVELEGQFNTSIAIVFGKGQALEGEPIVPTLHQLAQLVSGVVDTFEKALIARS